MATYKVIQDIEADDKLLGPLSLRQFIYASIAVVTAVIAWRLAMVQIFVALPLLLPIAFFGLLAAPVGAYQSSEIWLLAKIRYYLKPQRRIWDQTGLKELVTITAPKLPEKHLTNELSQTEVRSRLKALASTIDSRGWAIKNVDLNLYAQPGYLNQSSDRLIDMSNLPREVANYEVTANDDILDAQNNPTAQHLDQMINASSASHRQQVIEQLHQAASNPTADNTAPDYWFMNQLPQAAPEGQSVFMKANVVAPYSQPNPIETPPVGNEEAALLENIHRQQAQKSHAYGHMKTINPLGPASSQASDDQTVSDDQPMAAADQTAAVANDQPAVTTGSQTSGAAAVAPDPQAASAKLTDPAIINLANNDDLDVATIARQANKQASQSPDEVVISLH